MDLLGYKIEVIRSDKRRKTISARIEQNTMFVYAPEAISDTELNKVIDNFTRRFQKRKLKRGLDETHDLKAVAKQLNSVYFNGSLYVESIEYTAHQDKIFGSCNYKTGRIRLSHRLAKMPHWVRDYVVIHEMAHLIEPNHSKVFWDIVHRYKLAERAIGYLIAKGFNLKEGQSDIEQEA